MDDETKSDVAKLGELLLKLGPAAGDARPFGHDERAGERPSGRARRRQGAEQWKASGEAMQKLAKKVAGAAEGGESSAADAGDGEEEDDEEREAVSDEDGEASPPGEGDGDEIARAAPSAKPRRKRLVAGQFEVGPRVTKCSLRRITDGGARGGVVGRANEQGMEENEWRVELMTPERMRAWFGAGRYWFEWFGNDDSGTRVALGHSRPFRVYDDLEARARAGRRAPRRATARRGERRGQPRPGPRDPPVRERDE